MTIQFVYYLFLILFTDRPTEIPEADVFVCASLFDEINQQIRKLPQEGLKKYAHVPDVTQDEIYFFTKILNPPKVNHIVNM